MSPSRLYVLQVECEGLRVGIYLNGVQIFIEPTGAQRYAQSVVNPYVVVGRNRLELVAEPPYDDKGRRVMAPRALSVMLIKGEHGREPGPDAVLLTQGAQNAPGAASILRLWAADFDVTTGEDFGRWAWQDAPAQIPSERDRNEIVALMERLHDALARGDAGTFAALVETKTREMARALDIDEGDYAREQRAYVQDLASQPDWALDPLEPEALVLSPLAEGRLVMVTDPFGDPPIRGRRGGEPFALRVTMSKIEGAWCVVR